MGKKISNIYIPFNISTIISIDNQYKYLKTFYVHFCEPFKSSVFSTTQFLLVTFPVSSTQQPSVAKGYCTLQSHHRQWGGWCEVGRETLCYNVLGTFSVTRFFSYNYHHEPCKENPSVFHILGGH